MKKEEEFIIEEILGFDPFSEEALIGIRWILKNWDHEKESFSEFHKRNFGDGETK